MPTVKIPTTLRPFADGESAVTASGATLGEVLADITNRYPRLQDRLLDGEGRLSPIVHVFIGEDDARGLGGTGAAVAEDDVVAVVPAMAGGSEGTHPLLPESC